MNNQEIIRLENISKAFDTDTTVLKELNLNINKNEFITLLGPSGCGKTTTLRIIGGFETPNTGKVFFEGQDITNLPPHKRRLNTVFQKYALFPHMNVYENIAFGLRVKKVPESEIKYAVADVLEKVNLSGYEKRSVTALSGGQQQRIAIARAIVNKPEVLLLDEPLGALDLKLRKEMQIELKNIQRDLGITFIYVTHDQEEALTMSDAVVVMNGGVIQQIGTPVDIYNEPINAFVADFIGESIIVDGIMLKDELVHFCGRDFVCVDRGFDANEPIDVVIRPEDVDLVDVDKGQLTGIVSSVLFKGVHYEMMVETPTLTWTVHSTDLVEKGSTVGISLEPDAIHIMRKSQKPVKEA